MLPGMTPPEPWSRCPRISIEPETIADPSAAIESLQRAWFDRRPMVVELAVDSQVLLDRETCQRPAHDLSPDFEFTRERLHFLVWANSYDARSGDPIWWHGRKAARRFADQGVKETGPADIELPDGTPLYVDGGPFAPSPLPSGIGIVHRWNTEAGSISAVGHRPPEADLAPDQLAAVSHGRGGARVIAPAGSGKTRVLTERLRHLIEDCGADPSTVTALAFNRKAADELKERSGALVTPRGPHVQTLNSVGFWICNEYGGRGRLRVLEEPAVRDLVQSVFEVRRQANTDTVLPYIDGLSAIRMGLTSPAKVEEEIPDAQGLAEGFDSYRRALAEAGAVDFDEQIYRAIEILLQDSDARAAAQSRSRHLLVDEFQDLNAAHMLLIRLLCAPAYNCFGVGDDDQVIYGYSGATPEYLINFGKYFPGAHDYALEVNYRCPPAIVARSDVRPVLQQEPDRQDDQNSARSPRRRPRLRPTHPRAGTAGRGEGASRGALDARGHRDLELDQRRRSTRRNRGAVPGELDAASGPDRTHRGRNPVHRPPRSESTRANGYPDRSRLPAYGSGPRCVAS